MSSDLGMRRRRALWRATHRGTKEMDFLLGRFAERVLDSMNASEIAVFERLIETPDPAIESCVLEGFSLGEPDLELGALHSRTSRHGQGDGGERGESKRLSSKDRLHLAGVSLSG